LTDTIHTREAYDLADAIDLIGRSQRVAVLAHVNPDADAIGSLLGLVNGLRLLGKDAVGVLQDPVPRYALFLPNADTILPALPEGHLDLIICSDSADIERVGTPYEQELERFQQTPILNLDHHRTNPLYGQVNLVDAGASSSSEIAYRLLLAMGGEIDAGDATCLLFGLYGDTGAFQNGATTPGSLEVAADLVRRGADNQKIAFQLFEWKTFSAALLFGEILNTLKLDRERRIVSAYMTQAMLIDAGASADEMEGVAEYMRGIEEAEVVMLLKERPDGDYRVSMRSRPAVDVAAIASALGGGGHRQAAGCSLPGPVDAALAALVETYDRLNPR
jgi:phosphoesterase RecJ-like protein